MSQSKVESYGVASLSWRAPTHADLPAWARGLAAIEAVDRTGEVVTTEDLAGHLDLSYFDAATDARLGLTPDGEVVAFGIVDCIPSQRQRRVLLDGAVRPDWRGRGLGSALIAWQTERGRAVGAKQGRGVPGWLEVRGDEDDEDRGRLFAENGFAPLRYYLDMRRPLTGELAAPQTPPTLRLVPFDFRYDEAVRAAHNEAFADHWGSSVLDEETWATWVTGHRDFRADASFVVFDADEVVGYAINSVHPDDWPGLGFTEGWTHQLGVRSPWRGRGVAHALLGATMNAFSREGLDFAALDVDAENPTGALALYQAMGYERTKCSVSWSLPLD